MNDDRRTTGLRIGQVVGTVVALVCTVFGIPLWWQYVTFALQLSNREPFDQTETGFMVFGFLIWFTPVFAAVMILVGSFGWKGKVLTKISAAAGGIMTVVAIVVSVIAAT